MPNGHVISALSEILKTAEWQLLTDISGQPIGPIFKGQEIQKVDLLTLEEGTERLSRNVCEKTTSLRCLIFQKGADFIRLAAEA